MKQFTTPHKCGARVLVLMAILAWGRCLPGEEEVFDFSGEAGRDGVPRPWALTTSQGEPVVEVTKDETGVPVLHLKSSSASFFASNRSREIDPVRFNTLRWSWKGVSLPKGGDIRTSGEFFLSKKNKNDQALQVLLTFKNSRTLSYIWDTTAPAGTELKESNLRFNIQAIVVQSGDDKLGKWISYKRNIVDDYRRRHGGDPPAIVAITVQSNCNHTASKAEGFVGPITLSTE